MKVYITSIIGLILIAIISGFCYTEYISHGFACFTAILYIPLIFAEFILDLCVKIFIYYSVYIILYNCIYY